MRCPLTLFNLSW
uniref:Uncharacterized protein n=1 Tax=Arundo donax TaxID=35708 RepID=A0A0A8YY22_ARUDO